MDPHTRNTARGTPPSDNTVSSNFFSGRLKKKLNTVEENAEYN